ncbi:MAG: cation:proton antiporter [Trueperaceae bacterium]|nr:cation:proton antiporter [Trueperaceae bacterium]
MSVFLELALVLAIIVLGAKLSGFLIAKLNQPMVVGEITFGLLLGPTLINLLNWPLFSHHETTAEVVHLLAELGVLFLMFLAGLETDLVAMRKVGIPATSSAVGGVVLPFFGGWLLGTLAGFPQNEAIFVGTILTATSVSISAQTLMELGKLRTKEGTTILGAAVIDDVIGILMLSVVVAVFSNGGEAPSPIWLVAVKMLVFFAIGLGLAPLMRRILAFFADLPVSEPLLAGAIVIALIYGWSAEYLGGVAAITGSYLAGIILSQSVVKHELEEKTQVLVYSLLVPVFFVDIGLRANLREAFSGPYVWLGIGIVLVAIVGKIIGSGTGALITRFSFKESLRVGTGMISRGEVGLIVAGIGIERGVISPEIFSLMVLMVVVTTLVTPMLLRLSFGRESLQNPEDTASQG